MFHSDRFGHSSAELLPRPSARSAEDRSGHILGCPGLHTLDDVRVNVQRDVGRGVTEAVGYNLRVDAGAQGEARPCVTEIVKADPGEWIGCVVLVEPCEFAVELPGETIGVVRLAGCVAKQAVAAVGRTDQKAILGLTLPLRRRTATVPASSSITRARPVLVDPVVASWPTKDERSANGDTDATDSRSRANSIYPTEDQRSGRCGEIHRSASDEVPCQSMAVRVSPNVRHEEKWGYPRRAAGWHPDPAN